MIDFRYHIVSIVSIFLALAVGIVLGAGPLQGQLGQSLSNEVHTLRQTKEQLNDQLNTAKDGLSSRDGFITDITPEMVGGRLAGRSVTLIELPGASSDMAKQVTSVLKTAGAKVNGTVSVKSAWTDPAKKAARQQLATDLAPLARVSPPAGASQESEPILAGVLTRGLVTTDVSAADKPDDAAQTALAGLRTGGLIDFSGKGPDPATLAIVLAGPPTPGETAAQQQAEATTYAVLARALRAGSSGTLAISDADGTATGATLHAIRTDKQASAAVSTVDDADQPMGLITVVLAMREQLDGASGQYGTASGAKATEPDPTTS